MSKKKDREKEIETFYDAMTRIHKESLNRSFMDMVLYGESFTKPLRITQTGNIPNNFSQ